jgi:hypothetical protein
MCWKFDFLIAVPGESNEIIIPIPILEVKTMIDDLIFISENVSLFL